MQSMTTEDERMALATLASALEPFREINGHVPMPLSLVLVFLLVARREGATVSDLARAAGMNQAAMSRLLFDLSERNRHGGAGLGLIEQRVELADRRYMR